MPQSQPTRILYMEDDRGSALLFQERLNRAGYTVDLAADGRKGLAACKSGSYNVVCVDHHMPGLTGLDVIRTLSAEGALPPTIMLSGAGDAAVAVEAMKLGACDYIVKDARNNYLELIPDVIQAVLEKQRLIGEKRRAEEALQKAHDELEKQVKERTAELEKSNEELRKTISQRERAETKNRRQHKFLNHVLESLTHPFYIVDANDYRIIRANSASGLTDLSGAPTCYSLTHHRDEPCSSAEHPCPLEEVKKRKEPTTMEHVHYDEIGNQRVVEIHAHPIFDRDGKVAYLIEYSLDITERRQSEEALRELLETSANIVQSIPSGLLIYQYQAPGELFLVNANREAARLTGIAADEWRGHELDEMWPDARTQGLMEAFLRTMETGEIFRREDGIFKKDEVERFFRIRAFRMPGSMLGVSFEDVTELKELEHRVRQREVDGTPTGST
ncbi:MAG: PAS domain-containing protein [Deltaproteobacteria bacterium]